jgi:hypothetical protein
MATPYETVYGRFLNRVTDFNLGDLDDHTLNEMLKSWLRTAIVNTRTSSDLSARDDETEVFKNDLSDRDINPYQLETLLKEFGYETDDRDDNGWERDFWIYMSRKDGRHFDSGCENIVIMCCGMTFELKVYIQDEY